MMFAFEKLPREVRDIIYGYCLIHEGEIIPHPNTAERKQIQNSGGKSAKRGFGLNSVDYTMKTIIRSCAGIRYAEDWPSVALLGVSKGIQEEAASVLFGKNVWRLSFVEYWEIGEEKHLWYRYMSQFRHISTHMFMTDAANLPWAINHIRGWSRRGSRLTPMANGAHEASLRCLAKAFEWKHLLLIQMHLKSLVLDVENLFCPCGCCRERVLRSLCREMGREGPWCRLEVDENVGRSWEDVRLDIDAKRKINVKVVGLADDSEKQIFIQHWGLEVE